MIANKEKCADKDKSVCDYNEYSRLRYFHGMLLDDKDFQAEQDYHKNKRRFLNRMLHGSGVVCGLELNGKMGGQSIEVTSGLALDCSGNEIWVPRNTRIDLASLLPPKDKGKNEAECVEEEEGKPNTYYIGIRYEEKPSNPVSVYLPSGSCEERTCENSRYKEGFCVEIVECCPEKYPPGLLKAFCDCEKGDKPDPPDSQCWGCGPPPEEGGAKEYGAQAGEAAVQWCKCVRLEEFCEKSVPCPECGSCDKPCHVVLGKIEVDKECRLVSVCLNECRRYVLTGRLLQHMLQGVFAGGEKYFYMDVKGEEIDLPNLGELVQNPIKALCWFLRYQLIEGGSFETTDCGKKKEKEDSQGLETQLSAVQAQVQTLYASNSRLMEEINKLRKENQLQLQRMEQRIERQVITEKQDTAEKQTQPKPPKTPPK